MTSNTICTSCSRALRQLPPKTLHRPSKPSLNIRSTRFATRNLSPSARKSQDQPPPPRDYKASTSSSSSSSPISNLAAAARQTSALKSTTEPYIAYGSTEALFQECAAQCPYTIPIRTTNPSADEDEIPKLGNGEHLGEGEGSWYARRESGGLELDVTFNTWAQICFLYMWMLTVRLRSFPAEHARVWHQNLLDHFFYAAEDRMVMWHGMTSRSVRNRNLKDLWQQWRGVLLSYDEGLIKGDAAMAAAVWRNVFRASTEADVNDLATVVAFVRKELSMLDGLSDEKVASGEVRWDDLKEVGRMIEVESPRMKRVEKEAATAAMPGDHAG